MLRVIVTGGPGVGKTTMLRELGALGCTVVEESAREVIRERLGRGQTPRPEPREFAAELMRRDRAKYQNTHGERSPVFFDRCLVESVAMAHEAGLLSGSQVAAASRDLKFWPLVFVLPPWREIYANDAEREHPFEHCQAVHAALVRWSAGPLVRRLRLPGA